MAYRVLDVFEAISHQLGGRSKDVSPISIVNDAGERLVNMHGWTYLTRPPVLLDLIASQPFVDLPADFSRHVALGYTDSLASSIVMTTLSELQRFRTNTQTGSLTLYGSYSWFTGTDGAPRQRIEIWPTPEGTQTGALTLWYRAGWVDVTRDIDAVPIPPWCRPLFNEIARAVAAGYHNPEEATADKRISELRQGVTFRDAIARDRDSQADPGIPGPTSGLAAWFDSIPWERGSVRGPS